MALRASATMPGKRDRQRTGMCITALTLANYSIKKVEFVVPTAGADSTRPPAEKDRLGGLSVTPESGVKTRQG
jgi:hypothetical protein